MSNNELRAFMEGVVVANNGKIILTETGEEKRIVDISYKEDGKANVIYNDGTVIEITGVKTDEDGKIVRVFMKYNDENKYIDCDYSDEYLRSIGTISVDDIEKLDIQSSISLQDKEIQASTTEELTVVADDDYDGLGTVTIKPAKVTLQDVVVIPSKDVQIISADEDYDGLGTVTVEASTGGDVVELTTLSFVNDQYDEFLTYSDGSVEQASPSFNEDGKINRVTLEDGSLVEVEYDENGVVKSIGDIEINGVDMLSMFVKGGSGLPEIAITDEEPTDENIQVWIDPSKDYSPSIPVKHKYSLEEKVVGEWIDGRPIYEKVIEVNLHLSMNLVWNDTNIDVSNLNIDMFINAQLNQAIGTGFQPFLFGVNDNGKLRYWGTVQALAHTYKYLLIQYTKTTD